MRFPIFSAEAGHRWIRYSRVEYGGRMFCWLALGLVGLLGMLFESVSTELITSRLVMWV